MDGSLFKAMTVAVTLYQESVSRAGMGKSGTVICLMACGVCDTENTSSIEEIVPVVG
jgi:hypothetical protein